MSKTSNAETGDPGSGESISSPEHEDFSLVLGGPLYQLLLRAGLIQPSMGLVHRRILTAAIITWLPLAILTTLSSGPEGEGSVPFLLDLDVHVRLLISLPLLIGAELIVHRRMRTLVGQFLERGLIAAEDEPRFEAMAARAMKLRNSVVAEVLLLVISFIAGYGVWRAHATLKVASWYAIPVDGLIELNRAGYWYAFFCLPICRFILLRWYFRLLIWYMFLWRVSRLRLKLNALHPDRAGGLSFLANTVDAFAPVLIAQTTLLSGLIGNQIWHGGAKLPEYKLEIVGFVAFLMLVVLCPLMFFALQMIETRLAALREFGILASRYAAEFRQKWLQVGKAPDEALLGTGDIQSLADLGNSYEVVRTMRPLPFDRGAVIRLAIMIALPLLPLILTMIPLDELLDRLFKLVL